MIDAACDYHMTWHFAAEKDGYSVSSIMTRTFCSRIQQGMTTYYLMIDVSRWYAIGIYSNTRERNVGLRFSYFHISIHLIDS